MSWTITREKTNQKKSKSKFTYISFVFLFLLKPMQCEIYEQVGQMKEYDDHYILIIKPSYNYLFSHRHMNITGAQKNEQRQ